MSSSNPLEREIILQEPTTSFKKRDAITTTKAEQLAAFAHSVFDNPRHKENLENLLKTLKLSKQQVIDAYVLYDLDIYAYGNEIYDSLPMRFALHLHKLLDKSWHIEGQSTVSEYINFANPNTLVDMGFGIPTSYVLSALKKKAPQITLCDTYGSAFVFAEALLAQWDSHWSECVSFKAMDMNQGEFIGAYDLYMFQDSLEHVVDSETYLKKYIKQSPQHAHFIFSLPIGEIVPVHYITWTTPDDIRHWLKKFGLAIVKDSVIPINPAVDVFAEQLNYNFYTHILLCKKCN